MLGYNYRMTDIQAALGSSQLKRLDNYLERRNALARRYDRALTACRCSCRACCREHVRVPSLCGSAQAERCRTREPSAKSLMTCGSKGIGVNLHYMPVHLQPYYRELGFSAGRYPEAEAHGREAITLPMYSGH